MVNSLSLSGSQILNDIPRATTPTITPSTGVKMGDTIKITLNRASATFTHDLSYKFGDATGVIGDDIEVNTNWLIPRTLRIRFRIRQVEFQIICSTHEGTKLIGTTKIEFVLSVNTADIPTIDSVTFEETVIGIKEKFNAFIQGQSKIKLKVNATGVYGSKIASYEVKLMGLTYNKSEFIFDATQGGEVMIQTSVVDTRGKGKTSTQTINIAEYVTPTIELFDVKRCDNLGVENPQEKLHVGANQVQYYNVRNDLNDKSFNSGI